MKKMISLALCLTLALAFTAGCKKKEEAPAPAPAPAAAPAPEQKPMSSAKAPRCSGALLPLLRLEEEVIHSIFSSYRMKIAYRKFL